MFIATACSRCAFFCQYRPSTNAPTPTAAAPTTVPTTIPAMAPFESSLLPLLDFVLEGVPDEEEDELDEEEEEDDSVDVGSETLKQGMEVSKEDSGT